MGETEVGEGVKVGVFVGEGVLVVVGACVAVAVGPASDIGNELDQSVTLLPFSVYRPTLKK